MATMGFEELKLIIASGYANLANNKQSVNDLNVYPVPDGDTGTNMTLTLQYAVNELNNSQASTVGELSSACSSGALMGARGNSGVILSQLLRGFSKSCIGKERLSITDAANALVGATQMAYKAVMKPTEGTILTVAREMSEFAAANASNYESGRVFLKDVIANGYVALEKTPDLLPVLKEAGVVDAGGKGLLIFLEGLLLAMNGEPVVLREDGEDESSAKFDMEVNSDIKYTYCTEFLVKTNDNTKHRSQLIDKLIKIGDSLVCIEDNNIIKIHVHTNEPWNAMKIVSACGEFTKIKIENMKQQHNELFESEIKENADKPQYSQEKVNYVLVAVSSGEGLSDILKNLGVSYIIEGGQTMNPSTQDFLEVVNNTNADNYILLPNNKNIILAAEQAKKISDKNIAVLPTKNFPAAVAALMYFNSENTLEENAEAMTEGIDTVTTGQVTFAVRDSLMDGVSIKQGDIMGFMEGKITSCEKDVKTAAEKLVEKMIDEDSDIITLYYGDEVSPESAEQLKSDLEEKYPEMQIEIFNGGQPLYYYIVSVE